MPEIIIADTSCLILLEKIRRIELLQSLYGKITVTRLVAEEFQEPLPEFITIKNPSNPAYQRIIAGHLDEGEASALALALEHPKSLLIIDETKGRKEAKLLGINFTGTLGIILLAKERKIIASVREVIDEIQKTDFRISMELIAEALKISKEN